MALPRKEDMDRLVRMGKYLAAHPKYILHFVRAGNRELVKKVPDPNTE